jgi:heat shock protein HtpX
MNMLKTGLLMTVLTVLFVLIGGVIGGEQGLIIAFVFAAVMNFGSYWLSDKIVLSMYRAQEIGPDDAPELYNIVSRLAERSGLPMPRVYIIPTDNPNAFATGRNPKHAAVAVTHGLMNVLNTREIEAVLSHELSHVKNRDTLISTIAATIAGAITMLASMARWAAIFGGFGGRDDEDSGGIIGLIFLAILAPIAAMMIQLAISRSREYAADHDGGEISDPLALADALRKMEMAAERRPMSSVNPSTSHLFIVNPFKKGFVTSLFSTHPPTERRIERLESQAGRR